MRKKGIPEVLVRTVISLYEGAKTRVSVDSELSEEFEANMGMHQVSVLSPFLSEVVVDVVTELPRKSASSKSSYVDEIVLMSETIKGLRNKSTRRKEVFESKSLKVKLGKTKVMVSDGITQCGLSISKVDPSGVISMRVKAD